MSDESEYYYSEEEEEEKDPNQEIRERRKRQIDKLRQIERETQMRNTQRQQKNFKDMIEKLDICSVCYNQKRNCGQIQVESRQADSKKIEQDGYFASFEYETAQKNYEKAYTTLGKMPCEKLTCNHSFHWKCLYMGAKVALATQNTFRCPECRHEIPNRTLERIGIVINQEEFQVYDPVQWELNPLG